MGNNATGKHDPSNPLATHTLKAGGSLTDPTILQVVKLVIGKSNNANTRRAYSNALFGFLRWYESSGKPGFSDISVKAYVEYLKAGNLSPGSINLKLSAIRKLSRELEDQGLLDTLNAVKIAQINGLIPLNTRIARLLSREQAQRLINAPDTATLKGLRDRAILALMVGCGLNRSEISGITHLDIQQVQGRWAVADLVGKGKRSRTVPMPPWAKVALDGWVNALVDLGLSPIPTQRIFRAINKGDRLAGDRKATDKQMSDGFLSPQAVSDVLKTYTSQLGYKSVTSQAIRRTFAKLALKGGAEIDQIQLSLGHLNRKTTERFLDTEQNFNDAPGDRLDINLE